LIWVNALSADNWQKGCWNNRQTLQGGIRMKKILPFIALAWVLLLSGCATVPMASLDDDAQAKRFEPEPTKAKIYVYRNEVFGGAISMPVSLDGQMMGRTGPQTYFMWTVEPGKHEVASHAENTIRMTLDTQAGRNYYVWQEVKMGMWMARSQLHQVSEAEGQKGVLECKLLGPPE
jgi:hypothetical protein